MPAPVISADTAASIEALSGAQPGEEVTVEITAVLQDDGSFAVTTIDGTPVETPEEEMMLPEGEEEGEFVEDEGAPPEEGGMPEGGELDYPVGEQDPNAPFSQPFSDYEEEELARGGR